MKQVEIAVIGAGASGLMAARCAAISLRECRVSAAVALLEGNAKPGKKLLATGNGRCNLSNRLVSREAGRETFSERYHGDVTEAAALLEACPAEAVTEEFGKMGLLCRADGEGRLYPRSLQAAAVLQALRLSCEESGVECLCGFSVFSMVKGTHGFFLKAEDGRELLAKKVILATGGLASPRHSCQVGGYELAKGAGHSIVPCRPALTSVCCDAPGGKRMYRALKGMRCKARATLRQQGRILYGESGEVLFGDGTLSGICVFNLSSRLFSQQSTAQEQYEIELDLAEELSEKELSGYLFRLCREHPQLSAGELLSGLLNLRVGQEIVRLHCPELLTAASSVSAELLGKIAASVKQLSFRVTALASYDNAQITAGGVPLAEVDSFTMESKKQPGLYLTGELLNLDGDCGGYNLHWAWASGMAAGNAAAGKIIFL